MRWTVLVIALVACRGNTTEPVEAPAPADVPAPAEPEPAEVPPPAEPAPVTAAEPSSKVQTLYTECHDRVELPEEQGECTSDADCAPGGCGGEVCLKQGVAIMSTCEERPCFEVLDTCGCAGGVCTWSLKAEVPAMKPIGDVPR